MKKLKYCSVNVNKYLTEAMNECWHGDAMRTGIFYACDECGEKLLSLGNSPLQSSRMDFSTWQGFGKLWEWAKEQDWWIEFTGGACVISRGFVEDMVDPDWFAKAVYDLLKERNESLQ